MGRLSLCCWPPLTPLEDRALLSRTRRGNMRLLIVLAIATGVAGCGNDPPPAAPQETSNAPTNAPIPPAADPQVSVALRWENLHRGQCLQSPNESQSQSDTLTNCAASALVVTSHLSAVLSRYPQCNTTAQGSTYLIDCTGLCSSASEPCGNGFYRSTYVCPPNSPAGTGFSCSWLPP